MASQQQPKRKSVGKKAGSNVRRKLKMGEQPKQQVCMVEGQQQQQKKKQKQEPCLNDTLDIDDLLTMMESSVQNQPPPVESAHSSTLPSTVSNVGMYGVEPIAVPVTGVGSFGRNPNPQPSSSSSSGGGGGSHAVNSIGTSRNPPLSYDTPWLTSVVNHGGTNSVSAPEPIAIPSTVSSVGAFGVEPIPQPKTVNGGFYTAQSPNCEEVRLPIHDNVFISCTVFNSRPLISVRQFYTTKDDPTTLKPGKRGLSMTPDQWNKLKESPIYGAIIDCTFPSLPQAATQKPRMFPLGSLRYAVVENANGKPSVGLYQYSSGGGGGGYNNNNSTNLYRTEKGITLSLQQWEALEARKSTVDWIMGAVANGKSPLAWEVIEGIPV
ncbi:uncharacterized protein LOC118417115 [Branchiostoma floridae]|uniref:Activated RNA polymerase II transcriptional coactivator p15 n=1 Tax=Branchiostoma floridae TaxID=7739 RepID=C3XT34_BRAFL|nr:uncharacterized protein LOC118417115 [Branchiostoma floridae]|eukprot:XP_002612758.1 hypothetical protein BRAFLDRAFT_128266 [Branchiostoma floridae]